MTDNTDALRTQAREDLCRFLSACFYEPSEAFNEEGLFDSMVVAAARIDPSLEESARQLKPAFAQQTLEGLLVDYARLFLGPVHPRAAPYGSSWLAGEPGLMQETSMAVLELYKSAGFEVDEQIRDLPDHVAIELEFLYVLLFRESGAKRTGNSDELKQTQSQKHSLLTEHVGKWIDPFADAVAEGAETAFYRILAKLAKQFLHNELKLQLRA